jgi:hypothetical protein
VIFNELVFHFFVLVGKRNRFDEIELAMNQLKICFLCSFTLFSSAFLYGQQIHSVNVQILQTPCVSSGFIESTENNIQLFPNPVFGSLNVVVPDANGSNIQWKVLNALGSVVCFGSSNAQTFSIEFSHAPAGLYFIELNLSGVLFFRKLIVETN